MHKPILFKATATDIVDADPDVTITAFDCFKVSKRGKRTDKTESCVIAIADDTITIFDSGGQGDHIEWTVVATDASGNQTQLACEVVVGKWSDRLKGE